VGGVVSYWVRLQDGRNTYVVDLEQVSAFTFIEHGRVSFHLPGGVQEMVLTVKSNPEEYRLLLAYVRSISDGAVFGYWLTIKYDRDILVVNLHRIASFCINEAGKISFVIPDSKLEVVLQKAVHEQAYRKVHHYIQQVSRTPSQGTPSDLGA
jgi:hypothetical protein